MMLTIGLVIAVAAAAIMDVRERRIPNALTVSAFAAALVLRAILGADALVDGLLGAVLAIAVILPLFALGGVGGGDAKLLIVVGTFVGPKGFVAAMLATALIGGVMVTVYAIRRGVILPLLLNTRGLLKYVLTFGRAGERTTRNSAGAITVPYGVAIALGALFAVWYGGGV